MLGKQKDYITFASKDDYRVKPAVMKPQHKMPDGSMMDDDKMNFRDRQRPRISEMKLHYK